METKRKIIRAFLPCKLTESERLELGITASEMYDDIEQLNEITKILVSEKKQEAKDKTKQFNRVVQALKTGVIEKEIEATEVTDYENRIIFIEHQGERHKLRELTDEETQGVSLFDEGDTWSH
jgi:hypothetical protein